MASVRVRSDGRLFFDFRVCGSRCRELTTLADTPTNAMHGGLTAHRQVGSAP